MVKIIKPQRAEFTYAGHQLWVSQKEINFPPTYSRVKTVISTVSWLFHHRSSQECDIHVGQTDHIYYNDVSESFAGLLYIMCQDDKD